MLTLFVTVLLNSLLVLTEVGAAEFVTSGRVPAALQLGGEAVWGAVCWGSPFCGGTVSPAEREGTWQGVEGV